MTLEQESDWKSETRKRLELQAKNTAGILDLDKTVSGIAEEAVQ